MATMHLPPATGKSSAVLSPTTPNVLLHRPTNRSSGLVLRSSFLPIFSMRPLPTTKSSSSFAAPRFSMRVTSKQAYICRDCGYIYNDKTPFDKLPDKYFCPVCAAPKRRFRPYMPDVSKNVNDKDVRKPRKSELQRDEAVGKALPIAIAVGVLALAALYFYVNNTT
ncbi:rubredoxin-like protein [Arabis alpina]|uniref:Rubredoxin-like protein n=1 Tax=Arabis alpina TaxID=50452 RepID=A0A087GA21_ARAAL|nr:rubredoxin-like protein [Arabis alpina]